MFLSQGDKDIWVTLWGTQGVHQLEKPGLEPTDQWPLKGDRALLQQEQRGEESGNVQEAEATTTQGFPSCSWSSALSFTASKGSQL